MGARRTYVWLCCLWLAALGLLIFVANNFYWSASPQYPDGEHILFGTAVPEPFGRALWLAFKPMLLFAIAAAGWSVYRLVTVWRGGPGAGFCPVCGYDLRATPDRCPECGRAATSRAS